MGFEDEADEWPQYDGLGDPDNEDLPVHEGDEEDDFQHLEEYLREHPSGLSYYDQFVQQALFWLREELETDLLVDALYNLRTALKQDYGPKLRASMGRPLLRLKQAVEGEQPDMVMQLLIKLNDVLIKRPEPNPQIKNKPFWPPPMLN